MPNRVTHPQSDVKLGGLSEAISRLRGAGKPDTAAAAAGLVEAAQRHCDGPIELAALTEAADVLLSAFEAAPPQDRPTIANAAHAFIDLARLTSVRHAAYPADIGHPGGQWLQRVISLIDNTDFTVGRMFRQRAAQHADKTLWIVPHGDIVTEYSWREIAESTERIARGILAVLGEDAVAALFTPNCVEGALVDLACLTNGIFNTMVPANAVDSQLKHILTESGARILFVSGAEQLQRSLAVFERIPTLECVVTLSSRGTFPGAGVMTLDDLVDRADEIQASRLTDRLAGVRSSDIATTMYTSGTTGAPKGIKFSHLNLVSKRFSRAAALPDIDENEVFLCYLPLYHTFGRYLEMLGCVHLAATYVFAESASTETLIAHMKRFRPTAMISVPKKWLDLYRRVNVADGPPDDPEEAGRALRELTGGRLRWGLSAAGRLDPAIFRFYQYNHIDLLSGYGMTEGTGGITMTPPGQYADNSIGTALPGIELGFGEDHELLLRGPYVTPGYTDEQDNAASFRDGWFCTGDIVSCDDAGFLAHVDRKKDIYKNASGRTIAPQRVEALFADFPEVSRVFAVGDGREYVTLLVRPNVDYPELAFDTMSATEQQEYFRGLVASCNRFLAPFERIVNFAVIDRDFSLEKEELTPKGSFRRTVVEENFRDFIEPMYASASIERIVGGVRVRIPVAFLQHLGVTESGVHSEGDLLTFQAIHKQLRIRSDANVADRVWIGNCCYDAAYHMIDLDDWFRLPALWVGNAELTHITGEGILLWSVSGHHQGTSSRMVGVQAPGVPIEEWVHRLETPRGVAPSLLAIHAAAVALSAEARGAALRAVDYLAGAMTGGRVHYQDLAEAHLQHASQHPDEAVRSRAFVTLVEHQPAEAFGRTASVFTGSLLDFLVDDACERLASSGIAAAKWTSLTRAFSSLRRTVAHAGSDRAESFAVRLLRSLARLADLKEDFFLPVRRELAAWRSASVPKALRRCASELAESLTESFRQHLGIRQDKATDPATGRDYTWGDTLLFEDGIDPNELERMTAALQHTELIREAVYIFHQRQLIDLDDLSPGSIWVSLIRTQYGRSIYHVGVRPRSPQRCDFTLYVRNTASRETFLTDLGLMCVAAGGDGEAPLTPQLGGYFPEYGIATLEHIPGESVQALIAHMHEHPDKDVRQRLKDTWKHLSWSALTAAFEFYRRTEAQWTLTGTLTRSIAVPLNDFDENTRIASAAGWQPFESPLSMIQRVKHAFADRVNFHFPSLRPETGNEVLFAAAIEALGLREGIEFLRIAIDEGERNDGPSEDLEQLCREMKAYVRRTEDCGYMPKSLCFAIARYHSWAAEVPDADVHARAIQLQELQSNYRIDAAAKKFPGSRLRLYAETVLKDSPAEGKATIEHAIHRLREGADIKDVLGRLYTDLQEKLPSYDQRYFLTRAAYPHLALDEKAELVTTSEAGPRRAELVTSHIDRTNREVRIRPAASAREIDTLHRIFYIGGIGGGISAHEKFLVTVDQAGYVIAGVGYFRRTPKHVLLDKIAVLPRCRGRGIGKLLLHEFLRRQAADGADIVSAQFIRAQWLSQFGFQSHLRYAGVVFPLGELQEAPATPDAPEPPQGP